MKLKFMTIIYVLDANSTSNLSDDENGWEEKLIKCIEDISIIFVREEFRCRFLSQEASKIFNTTENFNMQLGL